MGYCFVTVEKIHSLGTLSAKDNHNNRRIEIDNADPALKGENKVLYGNEVPYTDFFKERISSLPYYKNHKIRSGQVLAYEVVTTFSREDREHIDLQAWQEKNVEWLKKTFNRAGDGRNNIASVMYHADEPGNVHCHAIVIPIDERGHLNASAFTDGSRAMSQMQSSYAKDMKEFGLERGLEGSSAKHKDIRKFYADLNRAINVPEVLPGENAIQYRSRVFEDIQTLQAAAKRKRDQEYSKFIHRISSEKQAQKKELEEELRLGKRELEVLRQKHRDQITGLETRAAELKSWIKSLETSCNRPAEEILKEANYAIRIRNALKRMKEQEPDKAEEVYELIKRYSELEKEIER